MDAFSIIGFSLSVFGLFAFAFVIPLISLPEKVKRLQARVRKLEANNGGEPALSEILQELEGKQCTLCLDYVFSDKVHCTVEQVEAEWVKVTTIKGAKSRIIKIDEISEVIVAQ